MIGHTMPAAGMAGFIKAALALYHKVLPPTLHVRGAESRAWTSTGRPSTSIPRRGRGFTVSALPAPRAGVNSFGFGGINAHVVLEEFPRQRAGRRRGHPLHWDTEVCIVGSGIPAAADRARHAGSREYARARRCDARSRIWRTRSTADAKVGQLAWPSSPHPSQDLGPKLAHALARLADPHCRQIKDSRGIYFFEEPSATGKLAFLFPGEGSQYLNMLLDLCLHFPQVRACFDRSTGSDGPSARLPAERYHFSAATVSAPSDRPCRSWSVGSGRSMSRSKAC